jgi:hypothetical protein
MPKPPITRPSRLERLLFARLGDHYTRNHPRVLSRLAITDAGANVIRLSLKPELSMALTRGVLDDFTAIGFLTSMRGCSEGGSQKSILIYSLTDEAKALILKSKEVQ